MPQVCYTTVKMRLREQGKKGLRLKGRETNLHNDWFASFTCLTGYQYKIITKELGQSRPMS